jgi:leader peptidase (prepilin peptidase)/N-methyltransferase
VGYGVVILYSLLGLLAGAFLNLAANRLPQRRPLYARPSCPECGAGRSWWEVISVVGVILRRRRCPNCGKDVSLRGAGLEIVTAIAFGFFWLKYGLSIELLLVSVYTCFLFLIFVIDLEHRLILRVVVYPAIGLGLLGSWFYPGLGVRRALVGGAAAWVFFFLVAFVGRLVFRRTAMGGGDANLAAFVGVITGFPDVILALLITVCLGGLVSLALVAGRFKGLQSYIPYGVFLVVGGMIGLVFGREIIGWYLGIY